MGNDSETTNRKFSVELPEGAKLLDKPLSAINPIPLGKKYSSPMPDGAVKLDPPNFVDEMMGHLQDRDTGINIFDDLGQLEDTPFRTPIPVDKKPDGTTSLTKDILSDTASLPVGGFPFQEFFSEKKKREIAQLRQGDLDRFKEGEFELPEGTGFTPKDINKPRTIEDDLKLIRTFEISKMTGLSLHEVDENYDDLINNPDIAEGIGFNQGLSPFQMVETLMIPAVAGAFIANPIGATVGLASFTALDTILPVEKITPKGASRGERELIRSIDIMVKGGIIGLGRAGFKYKKGKMVDKEFNNLIDHIKKTHGKDFLDNLKKQPQNKNRTDAELNDFINKELSVFKEAFKKDPNFANVMEGIKKQQTLGKMFKQDIIDNKRATLSFASEDAPLKSNLKAVASSSKISDTVNGLQALNTLKKSGLTDEEIEFSGVEEFLKGKKKVKKEELVKFIEDNKVRTNTISKGGKGLVTTIDTAREHLISTESFTEEEVNSMAGGEVLDAFYERKAHKLAEDVGEDWLNLGPNGRQRFIDEAQREVKKQESNTKYEQYTLPGGENYQEHLITFQSEKRTDITFDEYKEAHRKRFPDANIPESELRQHYDSGAVVPETDKRVSTPVKVGFKSSHWEEPNVLAHVRTNDRVDAEGNKVLFVEEIQSDWHLEGRKKGYDVELSEKGKKALEKRILDIQKILKPKATIEKNATVLRDLSLEENALHRKLAVGAGVPNAPFKKNWHELGLKEAIRIAVEGGYDKVAWVSGTQTADRYDLSKQIEGIYYSKNQDGTYQFLARDSNKNVVIERGSADLEFIENNIGKELAKKIADGEGEETGGLFGREKALKQDDLKVGGEWANKLYDEILPRSANKYIKKWGSQVEKFEIIMGEDGLVFDPSIKFDGPDGHTYWLNTSGKMMAAPTLQSGGFDGDAIIAVSDFVEPLTRSEMGNISSNLEKLGAISGKTKDISQQGFTITPQMAKEVSEVGQPLFGNRLAGGLLDKLKTKKGSVGGESQEELPEDFEAKPDLINFIEEQSAIPTEASALKDVSDFVASIDATPQKIKDPEGNIKAIINPGFPESLQGYTTKQIDAVVRNVENGKKLTKNQEELKKIMLDMAKDMGIEIPEVTPPKPPVDKPKVKGDGEDKPKLWSDRFIGEIDPKIKADIDKMNAEEIQGVINGPFGKVEKDYAKARLDNTKVSGEAKEVTVDDVDLKTPFEIEDVITPNQGVVNTITKHAEYFESLQLPKDSGIHALRRDMQILQGNRLSGKITIPEYNKKIQQIRGDIIKTAIDEGISIVRTDKGKFKLGVRKDSGVFVPSDFSEYKKFKDFETRLGGLVDTTRMIQEIDGSLSVKDKLGTPEQAGPTERYVLWRTRDMTIQKMDFNEEWSGKLNKIFKGIKPDSKDDVALSKALESGENPSDAKLASKADQLRDFYNELLDAQNLMREMRGQDPIPFRRSYSPHILARSTIWGHLFNKNKDATDIQGDALLPDYVMPNKPFNERELARKGGMDYNKMVKSSYDLAKRYLSTAQRDIFDTSIIQNNKAFISQLESLGYKKAADSLARWNAEGYAGIKASLDRVANLPNWVNNSLRYTNSIRNLAVFPWRVAFNTGNQIKSLSFTIGRYGYRNTLAGLIEYMNPKNRVKLRDIYSFRVKTAKAGKVSKQDNDNTLNGIIDDKRSPIEISNDIGTLILEEMEKLLTGSSIFAGFKEGKAKGLTGDALNQFASDAGAKTQSMYNDEDRPGILRNLGIKSIAPYQTFKFELVNSIRELAGHTGTPPDDKREAIKMLIRFTTAAILLRLVADKASGKDAREIINPLPFAQWTTDPIIDKALGQTSFGSSEALPSFTGMAVEFTDGIVRSTKGNSISPTDPSNRKIRNTLIKYMPGLFGIGGGMQAANTVDTLIAYSQGGVYSAKGELQFRVEKEDITRGIYSGVWTTRGGKEYKEKKFVQPKFLRDFPLRHGVFGRKKVYPMTHKEYDALPDSMKVVAGRVKKILLKTEKRSRKVIFVDTPEGKAKIKKILSDEDKKQKIKKEKRKKDIFKKETKSGSSVSAKLKEAAKRRKK